MNSFTTLPTLPPEQRWRGQTAPVPVVVGLIRRAFDDGERLLLYLGLGFALAYGQLAYYQHARLRRILYDRGHIADDYPAFLNQTAERNLLRKVGGGYTFVHALLLQYFSGRAE